MSAWLDPDFLKEAIEKHNKAKKDAQTLDEVLPLYVEKTVSVQPPSTPCESWQNPPETCFESTQDGSVPVTASFTC